MRTLLGLTLVSLFGAGCGDRLAGATERAQAVLEARRASDIDRSLAAYGPTFYAHVSRDAWRAKLIETGRAAGQIEAYELAAWSSQYSVGWGRTGEVVQLKYRVRYALRAGDEVFVIFRPWFIGDVQLAGHHIVVTPDANLEDPEGEVTGINLGIGLVLPLSHIRGSFRDFEGESIEESTGYGVVQLTDITTSSGRHGKSGSVNVGPSVAATRLETVTTFYGCPR